MSHRGRRQSKSPSALFARRSNAINDATIMDVMRRDRWQHQSIRIRTKAMNIARQKRSLQKIEAQLQKKKYQAEETHTTTLALHSQHQPLRSQPQEPSASLLPATSASNTTANTTTNTTATAFGSSSAPLPSTSSLLLRPHSQNRPSLPHDDENSTEFEARMRAAYLKHARLRQPWGNIPDPWSEMTTNVAVILRYEVRKVFYILPSFCG